MSEFSRPRLIAIVTGMLGSGKTTMISRILRNPAMADTLVLVNEFGEIGLDHHLLKPITDAVVLLPNGCLCCTVKEDVLQTLREMRRDWLSGAMPDVGRVLIETTGLAEPAPLIAAIVGDPLIADTVQLAAVSTVVDAEHGLRQIEDRATCRNQIRVADHLLVSKHDLVDPCDIVALMGRLGDLNPLAAIERTANVRPDRLFERDGQAPIRSTFACDEGFDHLAGIETLVLRPSRDLYWRPFQIWLGTILERYGDHVLRLKGRLSFADVSSSVVIQAVHYHFYPIIPISGRNHDEFLVLIFDRKIHFELVDAIHHSQLWNM